MTDITLAGITLPGDLVWSDEFQSWKVGQARKTSLTGALILHVGTLQAGRPITLETSQEGDNWVAREGIVLVPKNAVIPDGTVI